MEALDEAIKLVEGLRNRPAGTVSLI